MEKESTRVVGKHVAFIRPETKASKSKVLFYYERWGVCNYKQDKSNEKLFLLLYVLCSYGENDENSWLLHWCAHTLCKHIHKIRKSYSLGRRTE